MLASASSNAGSFLSSAAALYLAILTFLGTGVVYIVGAFRSTRNTNTLVTLKNSLDAYERQDKVRQGEIADLQKQVTEKDEQIKELQGKVSVLQDVVTGRQLIEQLQARTEELAQINRDSIEVSSAKITEVLRLMADVRSDVRELAKAKSGTTRRPPAGGTRRTTS